MLKTRTSASIVVALLTFAAPSSAQIVVGGDPNTAFPGFHAWFDAADGVNGPGVPADLTPVTAWFDLTLQGHDLVRVDADPTRQATFVAGALNGLPAVRFDGDDYIWGDGLSEFGVLSGGQTFFVVTKADLADNGYVFDSSSIQGRNALMTGQNATPMTWQIFSGNGQATLGPPVSPGTWAIHSVSIELASNDYYIDGVLVGSGTEAGADMFGMILGSRYTLSQFLTGEIAEVLAYDVVLSDADRQLIEGYLTSKWFATPGTSYCIAAINSTGAAAQISATGSTSVSSNDLVLHATPVPNQPGIFFYGPGQTQVAFGNGFLCISGTIGRLAVENASGNLLTHMLDNTSPPNGATVITPGSTWNFQAWYRDPVAGGAAFNLSNGLQVSFTP